jgi:hypothetical protein
MAEGPGELAHEIAEEVKSLEHEAAEGASARTPAIVLSGITLVLVAVVATVLLVALLAYYLTK